MHHLLALSANLEQQLQSLITLTATAVVMILIGYVTLFIAKLRESMLSAVLDSVRAASQLRPLDAAAYKEIAKFADDIRARFGAHRVCVFQFHNGDVFMLSNHAWKFSCTHESLRQGASSTFRTNQSLAVGNMIDWVYPILNPDAVSEDGVRMVPCCADIDCQCKLRAQGHRVLYFDFTVMPPSNGRLLADKQGIESAYMVNMVDPRHTATFGFIMVQFQGLHEAERATKDALLPLLCNVAREIQFRLTSETTTKKKPRWRRFLGL